MNRYDSVTSLIWFLVGMGIVLWSSVTLRIGTLTQPGPGFLPVLCGVCIAGLAPIIFFQAKGKKKEGGEPLWTRGSLIHILVTIGMLLIYAFILEHLGFVVTTFILTLLILTQVAETSWVIGIVVSLIATGSCYFSFGYLMKVQLPKGWLGF